MFLPFLGQTSLTGMSFFLLSLQTPLEYLTQALKEDIQKVFMSYVCSAAFPHCHTKGFTTSSVLTDMECCSQTGSLQGSCTK